VRHAGYTAARPVETGRPTNSRAMADFIAAVDADQAALAALLDDARPACPEAPGVTGAWSLKDVVAKLTNWRQRHATPN
jgi:hypothetical protein